MANVKNEKSHGDFLDGMIPDGFETVRTRRDIEGYVQWADGVVVQGILREVFEWEKDGKERHTAIVTITKTHDLTAENAETREEFAVKEGTNVGLDVKYALQTLSDHVGREVFIACKGKEDIGEGKTVWNFDIGVNKKGNANLPKPRR